MKTHRILSFTLVATLSASCSPDKSKIPGEGQGSERAAAEESVPADMSRGDAKDFLHHMAIVNATEIELGKLARERGTTETIKKFAQMMIDQHTASGEKVKALASDLKIDTPDRLDDQHLDQRDKLAKQSGTDFDREYTSTMVDGHKDLIDQLEHRIDKKTLDQWKIGMKGKTTVPSGTIAILPDRSDDPTTMRVNQLAADIYPTVYAHLEAARAIETSLKKR